MVRATSMSPRAIAASTLTRNSACAAPIRSSAVAEMLNAATVRKSPAPILRIGVSRTTRPASGNTTYDAIGMKIRISSGLIAWICDSIHSMPRKLRSSCWACITHAPPVWSYSAQKTATNA